MKTRMHLYIIAFSLILTVSLLASSLQTKQIVKVLPTSSIAPNSIANATNPISEWKTYTNQKYMFSIKYPNTWKYEEVPPTKNLTPADDQKIFINDKKIINPTIMTVTDLLMTITKGDPSLYWKNSFSTIDVSKPYKLGNISAYQISGRQKNSNATLTIIIASIGDHYIQIRGFEGSQNWKQILSTFEYFGNEIEIEMIAQNNELRSGVARLTNLDNDRTLVVVDLDYMAGKLPISIYSGSCSNLGEISYSLTKLSNGLKTNAAPGKSKTIVNTSLRDLYSMIPLAIGIRDSEAPTGSPLTYCGNLEY